jgi:hypothetical protein
MTDEIEPLLRNLHLRKIAAIVDDELAHADKHQLSYGAFLLLSTKSGPPVILKFGPPTVDGRSCVSSPVPDDGGGRSWITVLGYPRTGGRVLCVHGSVSVHGLWCVFSLSSAASRGCGETDRSRGRCR